MTDQFVTVHCSFIVFFSELNDDSLHYMIGFGERKIKENSTHEEEEPDIEADMATYQASRYITDRTDNYYRMTVYTRYKNPIISHT